MKTSRRKHDATITFRLPADAAADLTDFARFFGRGVPDECRLAVEAHLHRHVLALLDHDGEIATA